MSVTAEGEANSHSEVNIDLWREDDVSTSVYLCSNELCNWYKILELLQRCSILLFFSSKLFYSKELCRQKPAPMQKRSNNAVKVCCSLLGLKYDTKSTSMVRQKEKDKGERKGWYGWKECGLSSWLIKELVRLIGRGKEFFGSGDLIRNGPHLSQSLLVHVCEITLQSLTSWLHLTGFFWWDEWIRTNIVLTRAVRSWISCPGRFLSSL